MGHAVRAGADTPMNLKRARDEGGKTTLFRDIRLKGQRVIMRKI